MACPIGRPLPIPRVQPRMRLRRCVPSGLQLRHVPFARGELAPAGDDTRRDEMTRDEHVEWCKKRAREYLDKGDLENAIASMISDMNKHPECRVNVYLAMVGIMSVR